MKRNVLVAIMALFLLSACNSREVANSVTQLEKQEVREENKEDCIKNSLFIFSEIKEATVSIDNNNAVISINLTHKLNDVDLINLKERIIQNIQKSHNELNRITVNTGLEMKENSADENLTPEEAKIKNALKNNENKEIFEIPAPNL